MSAAKKLELEQGSKEWLEKRYDYVTASQVAILFDLSPYETPLGLFEEKVMRQEMQNIAGKEILFERGHNAEKRAREWLKDKGFHYQPAVMVNEEFPDQLASLDGITSDGKRIFECKFVGAGALKEIRVGNIPPLHACQIQAALLVSKAEVCDYFATDPSGDSHWIEVKPDATYQLEISAAAKKFMDGVRSGTPPEAGERDFFIPEKDERFDALQILKSQVDDLELQFEALKTKIIESYQDKRRVRYGLVTIVKSIRKGNIDYAKVPSLRGIDLEKYRKASTDVVTVKIGKAKK